MRWRWKRERRGCDGAGSLGYRHDGTGRRSIREAVFLILGCLFHETWGLQTRMDDESPSFSLIVRTSGLVLFMWHGSDKETPIWCCWFVWHRL